MHCIVLEKHTYVRTEATEALSSVPPRCLEHHIQDVYIPFTPQRKSLGRMLQMCKIERMKSGVCGAGLDLNIHGRHVCFGDTYKYEIERIWLRLDSLFRRYQDTAIQHVVRMDPKCSTTPPKSPTTPPAKRTTVHTIQMSNIIQTPSNSIEMPMPNNTQFKRPTTSKRSTVTIQMSDNTIQTRNSTPARCPASSSKRPVTQSKSPKHTI